MELSFFRIFWQADMPQISTVILILHQFIDEKVNTASNSNLDCLFFSPQAK